MKKGTQYVSKRDHNVLILSSSLLAIFVFYFGLNLMADQVRASEVILSPLQDPIKVVEVEKVIYKEADTIREKIEATFGEYSDEAFELLKCENRGLDPRATNHNKDGSTDWGVFQLNDNWNGFNKTVRNEQFLTDPDINISIAFKLFVQDGHSFKMWACGK